MLYSNDYHWPFQAPSSPSAPDPPAIRTPFFWHNLHLSHFLCVLVLARQKTTDPGRSQVMLLAQPGVPVMGAGPLHSPPCCIPPPLVWVEQAQVLPKGATLTAPHFHSSSRPAQQPGVGGMFGGLGAVCPRFSAKISPVPLFWVLHPPPPPFRSSLGTIRAVRSAAGPGGPSLMPLPLGEGTDWPGLVMTQEPDLPGTVLPVLGGQLAAPCLTHADLHWPMGQFSLPASSGVPQPP